MENETSFIKYKKRQLNQFQEGKKVPNSITPDRQPCINTTERITDGKHVNAPSYPFQKGVTELTTNVSNSQNTMASNARKRSLPSTHENSKKLKLTPELRNNLLLLADAAANVKKHDTEGEPNLPIRPTPQSRNFSMENLRKKIMGKQEKEKNVNTKFLPTSKTPLRTSQEINTFIHEVTNPTYMINNGQRNLSQELIKFEDKLYKRIYFEFHRNKKTEHPLDDKGVWEKIKNDLIDYYKSKDKPLAMWNTKLYQKRTDDTQNITLKTVDMVKNELMYYLRQDLNFFIDMIEN
ncbi:hypothetical protein [Erwinia pyrifoliae]|uniref:hypothetical protein n=1 Tax=Erwinia pyrifoliae TaxID=79967 RepID=UPI0022067383|nr:hypothetical protein [Erwinia pyrifoliae]UWS30024.1 hypothetical protein NYP81_00390 [Erwinia pyrifoliae]